MLKKRLGIEAIERNWGNRKPIPSYFKIPSSLTIPEGCENVGGCAFQDCNVLERLKIPGSVKSIGVWSFLRCYGLKEVVISESRDYVAINYSAFYLCKNLEKVEIPRNVNRIGGLAFLGCEKAEIVLEINKDRVIERDAFYSCKCKYVEKENRP